MASNHQTTNLVFSNFFQELYLRHVSGFKMSQSKNGLDLLEVPLLETYLVESFEFDI